MYAKLIQPTASLGGTEPRAGCYESGNLPIFGECVQKGGLPLFPL